MSLLGRDLGGRRTEPDGAYWVDKINWECSGELILVNNLSRNQRVHLRRSGRSRANERNALAASVKSSGNSPDMAKESSSSSGYLGGACRPTYPPAAKRSTIFSHSGHFPGDSPASSPTLARSLCAFPADLTGFPYRAWEPAEGRRSKVEERATESEIEGGWEEWEPTRRRREGRGFWSGNGVESSMRHFEAPPIFEAPLRRRRRTLSGRRRGGDEGDGQEEEGDDRLWKIALKKRNIFI